MAHSGLSGAEFARTFSGLIIVSCLRLLFGVSLGLLKFQVVGTINLLSNSKLLLLSSFVHSSRIPSRLNFLVMFVNDGRVSRGVAALEQRNLYLSPPQNHLLTTSPDSVLLESSRSTQAFILYSLNVDMICILG
jgi:hypothetical protein